MTDHPEPTAEFAQSTELAPPTTPAGWYPTPDGRKRYWDGARWTDLPWDDTDAQPAATQTSASRMPRRRWIVAGSVFLLVVVLVVVGIFVKSNIDAQATATKAAAKIAKVHEEQAAAAAAKKAKDEAARKERAAEVPGIEASIKTMAQKDAKEQVIDGPILGVTCSPVNGGSTDDLSQLTTVFECFVADKDNKDGTQSGYYFNATMNWSTGSYTYGLGKPGS